MRATEWLGWLVGWLINGWKGGRLAVLVPFHLSLMTLRNDSHSPLPSIPFPFLLASDPATTQPTIQNQQTNQQLPHKVLAMDCRYPYLAIATSNKDVHVYNLAGGVRLHKASRSVGGCCLSFVYQYQSQYQLL
jgi:hypothetical protein